jgi:glycosyltransferase involved in cell wall biosynthesis
MTRVPSARRRPTILIATDTWEQVNGITTLYRAVLATIDREFSGQCRLIIVYPAKQPAQERYESGHLCLGIVPRLRFRVPQYPELFTGYFSNAQLSAVERLHGRADVIHLPTQGLVGFSVGRYAKRHARPCVGFYHTEWPNYVTAYLPAWIPSRPRRDLGRTIAGAVDRLVYGACSSVVVHSTRSVASLPKTLRTSVVTAPEFADVVRFAGESPMSTTDHEEITFGYVGRLAREKGLDRIVSQARFISERGGRLLVVGDGPERNRLGANPHAQFEGWQRGHALRACYQQMTYLLMPADSDTLGLVLFEAGAAGVPAVALRGTVAADCIQRHESGVVVDDFSQPVLTRLMSLAGTPTFQRMRARAMNMARAHDVAIGTSKLLEMWGCH